MRSHGSYLGGKDHLVPCYDPGKVQMKDDQIKQATPKSLVYNQITIIDTSIG